MRYIGPTGYLSLSFIAWGALTIGAAFVNNARELFIVQFLLVSDSNLYKQHDILDLSSKGMTQAGFFPGMIIYFSLWYRKRDQTMRIALLFAASIVASGLGCMLVCHHRFSRIYST